MKVEDCTVCDIRIMIVLAISSHTEGWYGLGYMYCINYCCAGLNGCCHYDPNTLWPADSNLNTSVFDWSDYLLLSKRFTKDRCTTLLHKVPPSITCRDFLRLNPRTVSPQELNEDKAKKSGVKQHSSIFPFPVYLHNVLLNRGYKGKQPIWMLC